MFGIGPAELAIVFLIGAGAGAPVAVPLGVPPLPPDATVQRAAPEKCLLFFSSAGTATADPNSGNQTEQLLAEDEVREFWGQLELQINGVMRQVAQKYPQARPWIDTAPPAVKVLLMRPWAIYLDKFALPRDGRPPNIGAAMIVNCGDQAADVKKLVEQLEEFAERQPNVGDKIEDVKLAGITLRRLAVGDAPELTWGFKGEYFLLSVGPDAAAELLARLDKPTPPPAWLAALQRQADIQRVSTIEYVDVASIVELIRQAAPDPHVPALLQALGVANLRTIGSIAGLDEQGMVSRTFADFDGQPRGLFDLVATKPLAAADLRSLPQNVTLAAAGRADLAALYRELLESVGEVEPRAADEMVRNIAALEQQIGFSLEKDLFASLGDVWTLHLTTISPINPLSNLVATVNLRNKEQAAQIEDKLLTLVEAQLAQQEHPPFSIRETMVRGVKAQHLQPNGPLPVDPAWAIVDDRLIAAASLQALKAQLAGEGKSPGLAALPAVERRLKEGVAMIAYENTEIFVRQMLAMVQAFGPIGVGALAQQGIEVELPPLPGIEVIEPHILPLLATARRTKSGLVLERYQSVPFSGGAFSAAPASGILVALLLPAIQQAREAARRTQAANNLKQLGLAMLSYQVAQNRFPAAAIYDKNGKPLLSWRVALLPYLDEKELYDQFHRDEPWDSEHNKKLLAKIPAVYVNPSAADLGDKTVYLVPTGEKTMFSGKKGISLRSISDGMNMTIMIVEADRDHAVEWTKPDDLTIDLEAPLTGLRGARPGGFQAIFADGSVHFMSNDVDAEVLSSLFTYAGGEEVDLPD